MSEPCQAKFRTSKRGNPILIDSCSFEYTKNKQHGTTICWNCTERNKLGCKGSVATNCETDTIIRWAKHCHDPDPLLTKVRMAEEEIIESAAKHPRLTTKSLINDWQKATAGPAEKNLVCSKRTMERRLRRVKQNASGYPPIPKDWNDLKDLPNQFTQTFDKERFLLANLDQPNDERILVFASNRGLKLMAKAETWTCDGTFQCVPKPFKQLYSFMAEVDGVSYPTCFALLANKKGPTYRTLLELLYEKVAEKGDMLLKQIVLDFEGPVLKELKHVFGSHVRLTGCIVHFARSQRRKQGEIGNLITWQTKADYKIFTESLKALAYVKPEKVSDYFKCLVDEELPKLVTSLDEDPQVKMEQADLMKESINLYLDYFEKSYVGRPGRSGGWLRGKFPIGVWNQYDNVIEGRQLSTNRHESFHSRLKKSLGTSASIWALLDELIDEEAGASGLREENLAVEDPSNLPGNSRRKTDIRKRNRAKIRTIVTRIDNYEMCDFLKRVGYYKGHL